jgi:hypothetical protein
MQCIHFRPVNLHNIFVIHLLSVKSLPMEFVSLVTSLLELFFFQHFSQEFVLIHFGDHSLFSQIYPVILFLIA